MQVDAVIVRPTIGQLPRDGRAGSGSVSGTRNGLESRLVLARLTASGPNRMTSKQPAATRPMSRYARSCHWQGVSLVNMCRAFSRWKRVHGGWAD